MRVMLSCLAVLFAVLGGAVPAGALTPWYGTFSFTEEGQWTTSAGEKIVDSESFSYELNQQIEPVVKVAVGDTETSRPGFCGSAVTKETGFLPPGSGSDASGAKIPPLSVYRADSGAYDVTPPTVWLDTRTHSVGARQEGDRCVPSRSDSSGKWNYSIPGGTGRAPQGSVVLRGSYRPLDSNWIGKPEPLGVARWSLTCVDVYVRPADEFRNVKLHGITFTLGACDDYPARWQDVTTPDPVAGVKGSVPAPGPWVPAGKTRRFHAKLSPPTRRKLTRIFRHHRRARITLAVRVVGRVGPSMVVKRKIVITR